VRPPDARGFTLVEVLVAMVVLATVAVAVLELFGGGLRLLRATGDHVGAAILADAKLEELAPGPLDEGTEEGTEGLFQWSRRVTLDRALLPLDAASAPASHLHLARVEVEVRWGRSRRLQLVTLRTWSTP
jgi:type II secretion system protein I